MTEGQVQGKWVLVRNDGEFEITEFELAGSNCISISLPPSPLPLDGILYHRSCPRTQRSVPDKVQSAPVDLEFSALTIAPPRLSTQM